MVWNPFANHPKPAGSVQSVSAPAVPGSEYADMHHKLSGGTEDQRSLVAAMVQEIARRPDGGDIAESLIVQLSKLEGVDMFGQHVQDRVFGGGGFNITPYSRAGAGTTVMPAYIDSSNEVHFLMGRKLKDPKNPAAGLSDQFILLGGYMDPHGLKGDNKKDYDHSLAHCALRELKEESGLEPLPGSKPMSLGTRSQYNVTNTGKLHTIVEDFLVNYGRRDTPPAAMPSDDIAQLAWVKASDITKSTDLAPQDFGSERSRYQVKIGGQQFAIRDDHGAAIESGIQRMQGIEVQAPATPPRWTDRPGINPATRSGGLER